ncbi:hypothetical protein BC826DRAFT_29910 [Russula brevipes]|nr:hypothetical protein BC826DRAFT_29910 [Russula brevipes]
MPQHRTSKSTPSATPIMSRSKAVEIIEIDDSEPGDCSHSGPIRPTTSRRGPMSSITPATAQLDQCPTVSQRHEPQLIEIDSDEPPDEPPPKRVRIDRSRDTPYPMQIQSDDDGGAPWDRGSDPNPGNGGAPPPPTEIRTIPKSKVIRGSAVEPGCIAPPRSNGMRGKEFIWVTARRVALIQKKLEKAACLPVRGKRSNFSVSPLLDLQLSPVTACFRMAGGAINKIVQNLGALPSPVQH